MFTGNLQKATLSAVMLIVLPSLLFAASISVPSNGIPTIAKAISKAQSGDTVWVEKGIYQENLFVGPGITLMSRSIYGAVIDGGGRGVSVTMASNCAINGFEIRNGSIGVFSSSAGNRILKCRITGNSQSGIMSVGNVPMIEDNIIAYNKGSGIQGWDVRSTMATINHNTIAYNSNHGLSLGGNSSIILENNIIAFNSQFAIKAEPLTVKITMTKNDVYENTTPTGSLPVDNLAADPLFIEPLKMNFAMDKKSQCIGAGTDQKNIGSRVITE
jgi:hypothetical protein